MSGLRTKNLKQAGMVSILVTMLLMIVISLIVLGFAQISRRNQRQALDRQLSTQAFYAAETGVNDAAERISQAVVAGQVIGPKTQCTNNPGIYSTLPSATLDVTNKVNYSCLLVNPTPKNLVYDSVGTTGTITPINASSAISSLVLTWQSKEDSETPAANCPGSTTNVFTTTSTWTCGYGVLRFDLVPTAGAGLTAANLQANTMTSFIVPLRPGSGSDTPSIGYVAGSANTNTRVPRVCSDTECSITITGLSSSQYYLRINSIYQDVSLQIVARDASNNALALSNAQAVVDSTGKAQDVLRRIQVRIPLTASSTNLLSDFALLSTEAVCKRFTATPGTFSSDASAVIPGGITTAPSNDFCS
jgi:Tfp pilus assembly protein PilX